MEPKLCECGCGQPTNIIISKNTKRGDMPGDYCRFVKGHINRGRKQTLEHRLARGDARKGHPVSKETRLKISERHKELGTMPDPKYRFQKGVSRGKREQNGHWKGGISWVCGYRCVYLPEHPRAHPNGYVYEHIIVAENKLGRPLQKGEVVHHSDGSKTNNDPDNIVVIASQSKHAHLHELNKLSLIKRK